jgi:hypothetical protein
MPSLVVVEGDDVLVFAMTGLEPFFFIGYDSVND